jgi:hypothetical protein
LLRGAGVRDRWAVLAWRVEEDDEQRYRVQRVWLYGQETGRTALILNFGAAGAPPDRSFPPGAVVDAELVFFPGAVPVRALCKTRHAVVLDALGELPGPADVGAAIDSYGHALAKNPWLEELAVPIRAVTPVPDGVLDAGGRFLPYAPGRDRWELVALGGGRPIGLVGEWDGQAFLPLAAVADGRYARA